MNKERHSDRGSKTKVRGNLSAAECDLVRERSQCHEDKLELCFTTIE